MAKAKNVNADVEVLVLGTAKRAVYAAPERRRIQKAIRDSLLLPAKEPYHRVQAAVKYRRDGRPEAIIATMLRAYTYTADIVRLGVDTEYAVRSTAPYEAEEEEYLTPPALEVVPSPRRARRAVAPDMVFGTPVPEISTAKKGVEYACQVATKAGYKVVKLLGKDANVANYRKYLTAHLKAFGSIGHGYAGGIVLFDGNLTSSWCTSLPRKALSPEVVYFNSCQVFNPPLQPAIMKAGARTFVGGKVNLLIGASEEVFKCFWTKVLKDHKKMGDSLTACEKQHYPNPGSHGIGGDFGKF